MSIPKTVIVALFLIAGVTFIDFLFVAPYAPFHSGGRYSGGIGEFMLLLQALILVVLGTVIKAFKPREKEWFFGGLAAVVVIGLLFLNGWIFAFAHA